MLHRHLHANAILAAQRQHPVDAPGAQSVILPALFVLGFPERVAEPDADVVASVGRELRQPVLEPWNAASSPSRTRGGAIRFRPIGM